MTIGGKQWSADTLVWVTEWGQVVHNDPNCPGIAAFGSKGESTKVRLGDRLCAVRRACKKCFGEFYGGASLSELDRLIERLHGRVDFNQPARGLIATTARLRFGDSSARPPSSRKRAGGKAKPKPKQPSVKGTSPSGVVRSSGHGKPPPVAVSKSAAKRRRDEAAAAVLGITVAELKAQRRRVHEQASQKKASQRKGSF